MLLVKFIRSYFNPKNSTRKKYSIIMLKSCTYSKFYHKVIINTNIQVYVYMRTFPLYMYASLVVHGVRMVAEGQMPAPHLIPQLPPG